MKTILSVLPATDLPLTDQQKLELIEEFIEEIGDPAAHVANWSQFTERKRSEHEVIQRLENAFLSLFTRHTNEVAKSHNQKDSGSDMCEPEKVKVSAREV